MELREELLNLSSVSIPATVAVIDNNAFYGCSNLRWISFTSPLPDISSNGFSSVMLTHSISQTTAAGERTI